MKLLSEYRLGIYTSMMWLMSTGLNSFYIVGLPRKFPPKCFKFSNFFYNH